MALTPKIMWTVLPNGIGSDGLNLSVFVSPRLDAAGGVQTGDYATLDDWPAYLRTLTFALKVGTAAGAPTLPVSFSIPSSALWKALFPIGTLLKPRVFRDHAQRALHSFSARAIHDYVEGLYDAVAAASPRDYPDLNQDNEASKLVNFVGATWISRIRNLQAASDVPGGVSPPLPPRFNVKPQPGTHPDRATLEKPLQAALPAGSGIPAAELYRAYRFYNRGQQEAFQSQQGKLDVSTLPEPPAAPKFDFHEVLAALADHPVLLRELGIVLDASLSATLATLAAFGTQLQLVVALPSGGPTATVNLTPATAFDTATFLPATQGTSDLAQGYLSVGNRSYFDVLQADVDAQALKTIDYAINMRGLLDSRLAALAATNCSSDNAKDPTTLAVPQSLPAQRNAGFTVTRAGRDDAVFALFQRASLNEADPSSAVLYYDDVLRGYRVDVQHAGRWFSLSGRNSSYALGGWTTADAPRLASDEGFIKAVSATSTAKDPPSGPNNKDLYLHEAVFGWHNWSLVVPRPGRSASVVHNDDNTQREITRREDSQINQDFPIAIQTGVPKGSLPRLRFGESYVFRARAVDLAGNGPTLAASAPASASATTLPAVYLRYEPVAAPALLLRAPVTSGESVEHLVIRSQVNEGTIAKAKSIFNKTCERHVAPPKATLQMAELHGMLDDVFSNPAQAYDIAKREPGTFGDAGGDIALIDSDGATLDPSPLEDKSKPLPNGQYTIHTSASPELPYLPDPMAESAHFELAVGDTRFKPYDQTDGYPYWKTFRIVLSGSTDDTFGVDAAGKGAPVSVTLPPGTMQTVRYSSRVAPTKLELLARFNNMGATARAALAANDNQHWMLTPYRELTFVHAVEKPLEDPRLQSLALTRIKGDTFVSLRATIVSHSESTGVVELFARWVEPFDRLQDVKPGEEQRIGRALERKLGYGERKAPVSEGCDPARHELGDTKHRKLYYYAVATTRYREYFLPLAKTPELFRRQGPETTALHALSSARPEPARILYVIPTFEWQTSDGGTTSSRVGRGLRVYVDRPWFSSGEDEVLGVIVPDAGDVPVALRKYVSEWGSDPIWKSSGPTSELQPEHFVVGESDAEALVVQTGLTLDELSAMDAPPTVTAVGVPRQYNAQRQLHFFDIVLDPGVTYFPFVRLALARFQPFSLRDCHLSRVSRVDFCQLVADRTVTLSYNAQTVDVTVSGAVAKNFVAASVTTKPATQATVRDPRSAVQATPGPPVPNNSKDLAGGSGRVVRAFVEQRENSAQQELGWHPLGAAEVLTPFDSDTPGELSFIGTVKLPASLGDAAEYRLTVQELEIFQTDEQTAESSLPVDNPKGLPLRSRLVYLDYLALSPP